ncbi:unnamed protein product [Ectocarpus sp. CCAP 1310/34]|nr:unnamed protein product [Ectocarpus sp. CCAP 1310/34]
MLNPFRLRKEPLVPGVEFYLESQRLLRFRVRRHPAKGVRLQVEQLGHHLPITTTAVLLALLVDVVHKGLFGVDCRSFPSAVNLLGLRKLGVGADLLPELLLLLQPLDDTLLDDTFPRHLENFRRAVVSHRLTVARADLPCVGRRVQFEPDGVAPFPSHCS